MTIRISVPTCIGLAMASALLAPAAPNLAQDSPRTVVIKLDNIRIRDEDDPGSNDEPYVIMTRFRMRIASTSGGGFAAVPGTLQVSTAMTGRYSLGFRRDDWADEGHTYTIPSGIPHAVQEVFPWNESGWVAGCVVTFMEADSFSPSTVGLLSSRIEDLVRRNLSGMPVTPSDTSAIAGDITTKTLNEVSAAVNKLDFTTIARGLITAVDPDDFGGIQIAFAMTFPGNGVAFYSGPPVASISAATRRIHLLVSRYPFQMGFPYGDLRAVPGNAKYKGNSILQGTVTIARQGPIG